MNELSLHILDIATNSTVADSTQVDITITADTATDKLTITIADNGRGIPPQMLANIDQPFVTSRTTRRVGLGIPLWKMVATQCGGSLAIDSKVGVGTTITATMVLSHIDRVPMGNLASTITTLLGNNAKCDISLIYSVDKRTYTFNSSEIREELGADYISDPFTVKYLEEMISENLTKINGGIII